MKMKQILMVLLLLASVQVYAAPVVFFDVSQPNIQVGQSFTIDVLASNVRRLDPLLGGFDINSSASWVLNSVLVGPDFTDVSPLLPTTDVGGLAGLILPTGDNIPLASLEFTAAHAGAFNFGIRSDLTNLDQGLLTLFNVYDLTLSQNITIASISQVPLPGALGLFTGALLWAIGFSARSNGLGLRTQGG